MPNNGRSPVAAFSRGSAFLVARGYFPAGRPYRRGNEDTFSGGLYAFNDPRDCHLKGGPQATTRSVWSGRWGGTLKTRLVRVVKGYFHRFMFVEGDDWKIRMLSLIEHPTRWPRLLRTKSREDAGKPPIEQIAF